MVDCRSCGVTVDGDASECPNCGYAPRTTLVWNGVAYAVLAPLIVVVLAPVVVGVFGVPVLPTLAVALVPCFVVGSYGVYLIWTSSSATVSEDFEEYVGFIIGRDNHLVAAVRRQGVSYDESAGDTIDLLSVARAAEI